jgi:hypothetical protein
LSQRWQQQAQQGSQRLQQWHQQQQQGRERRQQLLLRGLLQAMQRLLYWRSWQ